MKLVFALLGLLFAGTAFGVDYQTFCTIEAGKAKGYVSVTSYDSLTISGYVTFRTFDEDGDLIDTERTYEYAYIYHDTELVSEVDVDRDARFCSFDVSQAVDDDDDDDTPPPPNPADYNTHCEIRNGTAYGYVTVRSGALTVSGWVTLRIFDEDGDQIDEERSYEYEYIYSDTRLVTEEDVDDDARFCSLDVSEAVD